MAPALVLISTTGLAANACVDQSRMPNIRTGNERMSLAFQSGWMPDVLGADAEGDPKIPLSFPKPLPPPADAEGS
jgi:hypothetical protein